MVLNIFIDVSIQPERFELLLNASKKYKISPDILKYLSTNITYKISNFQEQNNNSNGSKIDGYIDQLRSLQSELSELSKL